MADPAAIALALPDVDQGIACAGTAVESRTFLVRKKTFLFLSKKLMRLKLERSAADAKRRGFEVGAGGWVKLDLDGLPPQPILKAWIAESYSLYSGTGAAQPARASSKSGRKSGR